MNLCREKNSRLNFKTIVALLASDDLLKESNDNYGVVNGCFIKIIFGIYMYILVPINLYSAPPLYFSISLHTQQFSTFCTIVSRF